MREEGRLRFVERGDLLHILVRESKVEHVEVFFHPPDVRRFGNDDDAALQMPAENDLRDRLAVLRADLCKDGIGEQASPAFAEGRPRLVLNAVLFHPLVRGFLLIMRVRFHLVDHRLYAGEGADVYQPVRIEVGNADGAQLALRIQFFQRSPCAVIVGITENRAFYVFFAKFQFESVRFLKIAEKYLRKCT